MHGVNNWFKVFTCHHYQSSLFSKCDLQPIIRMSLKHCSVWFHWNYSLWVQFHLSVHIRVHKICLLQNLGFLPVHSFSVPSLAVNGRVRRTPKGTPTVVRRGQTDWVHRLLCGLVLAGLGHYSQGHPTHRGPVGSPPCSVSSWVDGCAAPLPRWRLDRCDDAVK